MSDRLGVAERYWRVRRALALRTRPGRDETFWTRYSDMAGGLLSFLKANEVDVTERRVTSLGCGDGTLTLRLAQTLRPSLMVGFDIIAADEETLLAKARRAKAATGLPSSLHFERLVVEGIPAPESTFDAVLIAAAWSDLAELLRLFSEISRILRPGGILALMVSRDWPPRFPPRTEITETLVPSLEELQGAVLAVGLDIEAVTMDAPLTNVRGNLSWIPLSSLATRGVALLARAPGSQDPKWSDAE